jgi:diacylglycerol kinase family enzyme
MKRSNSVTFKSCKILINPVKSPARVRVLKRLLYRMGAEEIVESKDREHFIDSVRDFCRSDYKYLLVWGGDGSAHIAINEMVKALKNGSRKSVGFLRGGSGNGVHDSYEVPLKIKHQLYSYAESMRVRAVLGVDLLQIEGERQVVYGQLAGIGFDVHALKKREARLPKDDHAERIRSGLMNYFIPAIISFIADFNTVNREYFVELFEGDYVLNRGKEEVRHPFKALERQLHTRMIEIGKRPFYGNRFKVCPDVVCNNGYMDVYLFNFDTRCAVLRQSVSLWKGKYFRINKRAKKSGIPPIERYRVKMLKIYAGFPLEMHVDGELYNISKRYSEKHTLTFTVLPHRISFIVPAGFYRKLLLNPANAP